MKLALKYGMILIAFLLLNGCADLFTRGIGEGVTPGDQYIVDAHKN